MSTEVYHSGEDWLDACGLDPHDDFEVFEQVYHTLNEGDPSWGWDISRDDAGRMTISNPAYPSLSADENERIRFCQKLDEMYGWSIDAEAAFRHAMAKDD